MKLQLTLGNAGEHAVDVVARWKSADTVGVELVDTPSSASQALARYVAELLERGGSA
jgi:hypothetical protein